MNNKKILFVISSLKIWWGAERVVSLIWTKLFEKWYGVSYLTFYKHNDLYDFKWKYHCLNERFSSNIFVKLYKLINRAREISLHCKKMKIDTCVSFMEEANFPSLFSKILFFNRADVVISSRNNSNEKIFINKMLIKLLYNYADKIITLSKWEWFILINSFNIIKEKVLTIYNPLRIDFVNSLKKEGCDDIDSKSFTFINVGRLVDQKNHKLLINSFNALYKKYSNIQLIILWDWELRSNLELYKKNIISWANIHFLWLKKNPYKYMFSSDCFVFSSNYEWFWIVLIEAMACWLPIISCDCNSWPNEILKNGEYNKISDFDEVDHVDVWDYWILVPTKNENELTNAMEMIVLDEILRNELKKMAKKRAMDFDLEKIVENWVNIL